MVRRTKPSSNLLVSAAQTCFSKSAACLWSLCRPSAVRPRFRLVLSPAGSQLLEFALVLPFLLVFVAGIIDFSQAYHLKQRLNNAAREGARTAIWEPTADLNCGSCTPAPTSVQAVRDVVSNYLTSAGVTTCDVDTRATYSAINQAWTYPSSSTGCSSFSLEIDRAVTYSNGSRMVTGSRVILTYPYKWTLVGGIMQMRPFNGSGYGDSINITTDAIMQNLPGT